MTVAHLCNAKGAAHTKSWTPLSHSVFPHALPLISLKSLPLTLNLKCHFKRRWSLFSYLALHTYMCVELALEEAMEETRPEEEMEEARPAEHMEATRPPPLSPSSSSQEAAAADVPVISGAPGGPLFMPGYVSPLICVRNFQGSCVTVLMALQAELNDASIQCANDADLLVDDLKVVTEEQLVNHALKKIVEEKISGAIECGSESSGQKASSSNPVHDSDEHVSNKPTEMPKKIKKQESKKRGRPFDRDVRAAVWGKDEKALSEETIYSRLKMEREMARRSCTLRSLSLKDRHKAPTVRLDCQKRLQALNFFVDPTKVVSHAQLFLRAIIEWIQLRIDTRPNLLTEPLQQQLSWLPSCNGAESLFIINAIGLSIPALLCSC